VKRKKMNTKKKNLRDDERAVSPVVGVILMVAITVIMAAVIGAFVYGYSGSMVQAKDVAAVARHQGTTIHVTYMGGPDQDLVSSLVTSGDISLDVELTSVVGSTGKDETVTAGQGNHVIVTATFSDETSQVILDTFC
jgi:flagellin-like protein